MFRTLSDQMGQEVLVPENPKKIISIVPSQTELLFDLGADDLVAGVTNFCIYPKEKVASIPKVGGTKQLDIEAIRKLRPDLIIGNKEENSKEQIELLSQEFSVWMSDITTLTEALNMIKGVGIIVKQLTRATEITNEIEISLKNLKNITANFSKKRVAYLIWRKPYMLAGKRTFIDDMINLMNFENCTSQNRYPVFSSQDLQAANPGVIILSTEPYPFQEKHIHEFQTLCPNAKVILAEGEMFCWPGSRLLYSASYLLSIALQISER